MLQKPIQQNGYTSSNTNWPLKVAIRLSRGLMKYNRAIGRILDGIFALIDVA